MPPLDRSRVHRAPRSARRLPRTASSTPRLVGALLLTACALLPACGEAELEAAPRDAEFARHRPNVILVSVDALRRDHLGLHGYRRDTSPWLDAFAEQSVVYERAYAAGTWTLISHMSMFTGLYAQQHGVVEDGRRLAEEIPTLAERLRELGYHTASLYRPGWIHERFGFDRGFDVVRTHEEAQLMAAHAREVVAERPRDKPMFLFLHAWDVHSARITPTSGRTIYDPPPGYDTFFMPGARTRLADLERPQRVYLGDEQPTPEQREAIVALYDGNIRYVDDVLRELMRDFGDEGLLDDALVIITSDHGEELNQREGVGGHGDFFEEGLRVPLVVRFPDGAGAGTRRPETVSLVDLLPTVLDTLGEPLDPWLAGLPLGGTLPRARMILLQRPPKSGLIQWPWKLRWRDGQALHKAQLYNLEHDPDELEPLDWSRPDSPHREVVGRLAEARDALRASWAPLPGAVTTGSSASPEQLRVLEELGYLGDG